ncbi:MAG: hypothetical protein ACOWWR_14865 [Eubacteriales bacterium]
MDYKSELYTSWPEYMQENNIKPEDAPIMAPSIQGQEEMLFGFIMFLLM